MYPMSISSISYRGRWYNRGVTVLPFTFTDVAVATHCAKIVPCKPDRDASLQADKLSHGDLYTPLKADLTARANLRPSGVLKPPKACHATFVATKPIVFDSATPSRFSYSLSSSALTIFIAASLRSSMLPKEGSNEPFICKMQI